MEGIHSSVNEMREITTQAKEEPTVYYSAQDNHC